MPRLQRRITRVPRMSAHYDFIVCFVVAMSPSLANPRGCE